MGGAASQNPHMFLMSTPSPREGRNYIACAYFCHGSTFRLDSVAPLGAFFLMRPLVLSRHPSSSSMSISCPAVSGSPMAGGGLDMVLAPLASQVSRGRGRQKKRSVRSGTPHFYVVAPCPPVGITRRSGDAVCLLLSKTKSEAEGLIDASHAPNP